MYMIIFELPYMCEVVYKTLIQILSVPLIIYGMCKDVFRFARALPNNVFPHFINLFVFYPYLI